MAGDGPQPLANDLWLAVYDDVRGRPTLPERSRGYGLGGALVAELVVAGGALVDRGRLHLVSNAPRLRDPALSDLVGILGGGPSSASNGPSPADGESGRGSRPGHPSPPATADSRGHRWTDDPGEPPADLEPPRPDRDHRGWPLPLDGYTAQPGSWWATEPTAPYPYPGRHSQDGPSYPPADGDGWMSRRPADRRPVPVPAPGPGQDLSEFLDYLAYDRRAERKVVDRLVLTGLAVVRPRRRLLGSTNEIVPRDGNVSGWPTARIRAMLTTAPYRLTSSDLMLAALLVALDVFAADRNRLQGTEVQTLRRQLDAELPPMIRDVCRAVQVAFHNAAINR